MSRVLHPGDAARRRRHRSLAFLVAAAALSAAAGLLVLRIGGPDGEGIRNEVIAMMPRLPAPATFPRCARGSDRTCVVDGDTFRYNGMKIRIADIDTPETNPPRCAHEADLGARATVRLQELLAEGPFDLRTIDRDEDRYGRKLRVVMRDGRSLGAILVSEGLARTWTGRREPWC